jgi:hypothetical protein
MRRVQRFVPPFKKRWDRCRRTEEMIGERGVEVDHSTLHRRLLKYVAALEKAFLARRRAGAQWESGDWNSDVEIRQLNISTTSLNRLGMLTPSTH